MTKTVDPAVREYLASIGKKGGKKGRGKTKQRPKGLVYKDRKKAKKEKQP
jgi:hypothetical protein